MESQREIWVWHLDEQQLHFGDFTTCSTVRSMSGCLSVSFSSPAVGSAILPALQSSGLLQLVLASKDVHLQMCCSAKNLHMLQT